LITIQEETIYRKTNEIVKKKEFTKFAFTVLNIIIQFVVYVPDSYENFRMCLMKPLRKKLSFMFILLILLVVPAMAGTKYMAGSPDLSAYISGTNEFSPGDDANLTIVIKNTGLNEYKFVQSGITDRDDLPNTAKFLTVKLQSGDAPLIIKTDPQMIGDLGGASTVDTVFSAKINSDALAGTYDLPLILDYKYLYLADQTGVDTIENTYNQVTKTIIVPIRIKPVVSIKILSAVPEHLNVGTEGYVNMQIKNTGSDKGEKAIVKIVRSGNSPIIPMDSSVYIGDFASGSVASCKYKVSVVSGAQKQTYPIDVVVVYQNDEGDFVSSKSDTIGIPVGGKIDFSIISPPAEMNPGNKKIINVEFKNTGDTTVYSSEARISAIDPFTSNNDIAYLGDLKPGDSVIASYEISVDQSATIKEYGLDSEIRYRDALDNTQISNTMKVKIDVTAPGGLSAILQNSVYLTIIIAAILGIIYAIFHYRKSRN
jgi:hypothetical protein